MMLIDWEKKSFPDPCQPRCFVLYSYKTVVDGQLVEVTRWSAPAPKYRDKYDIYFKREIRKTNTRRLYECGLLKSW